MTARARGFFAQRRPGFGSKDLLRSSLHLLAERSRRSVGNNPLLPPNGRNRAIIGKRLAVQMPPRAILGPMRKRLVTAQFFCSSNRTPAKVFGVLLALLLPLGACRTAAESPLSEAPACNYRGASGIC